MNKKLIKMIASIACGLGVATSIPFATTSCGSSSSEEEINALPYEVYEVDQSNVLLGFTDEFLANPTAYDMCNTMEIPANVTSIGGEAFYKNSASTIPSFIKKLTFAKGSNCSTIGDQVFKNCLSLTSVIFSKNLLIIGAWSFQGCSSLTSIIFSNKSSLTNINAYAFENCSSLTSVSLPNCLTTLDYAAFNGCSSLTSISFSSNLEKIEDKVFNNCPNLSSITWDAWNGNTDFQKTSFAGVYQDGGAVTVTNPSGYDSIKLLNALIDSAGLPLDWGLTLPSNVYQINEDNTLEGFTKEFLDNPDAYGDYRIMEIPARVTSVADNAFVDFPAPSHPNSKIPSFIKKLTFAKGSNCSTIGTYNFSNSHLTFVNFPSNLETIREYAFWSCYSLTIVNLSNCNNLSSIGNNAFSDCPLSTSLDLSKCINLTLIDQYAFIGCAFTSITFPGSLQSIGGSAFRFCSSLEEIIWNNLNSAPSIGSSSFHEIPDVGRVKSTGSYTSSELLSLLKQKGNLPDGWHI